MKKFINLLLLLALVEYISGPIGKCDGATAPDGNVIYCNVDTNIESYFCNQNTCKDQLLCEYGQGVDDNACMSNNYISDLEKEKYVCIKKANSNNCTKTIKCSAVDNEITSYEECRQHPVYENGQFLYDHICVSKSGGGCKSMKNICPTTEKIEGDTKCSYFPSSNDTKVCAENKEAENSCKEEFLCESADSGETDDECMNYIVSNSTKFICLKNPEKEGSICKEAKLCEAITEEDGKELSDSDCNNYPVSKENKTTHICIKDQKHKKCIEQILCELVQITQDNKEIICSDYPVKIENSDTHICVKNTDGKTPCIEEKLIPKTPIIIGTILETESLNIISNLTITSTAISNTNSNTNSTTTLSANEQNIEILIVLLGCSQFKKKISSFSFNIHFSPVRFINNIKSIFSKFLAFPVSVIYNAYLRGLVDLYANCTLNDSYSQYMVDYFCEVQAQTSNIKQVKLQPDFNFTSQNNFTLIGISPIANSFMDNLQDIDERFNNLFLSDPYIYIMDNSTIYGNNNKINCSGIINGKKPADVHINNDLLLLTNINSDVDKVEELNCTVTNIINDNYDLSCITTDSNIYDLQSSISIVEDGILLINFENTNQENGSIFRPESEPQIKNVRYHYNKSMEFGAGAIISIALASTVALATIIGLVIYCRKKTIQESKGGSSSIIQLKYTN